MIVEKSMHSGWLSNSYLVGDHEGGTGVLIDAGGPVMPLIEAVGRHKLTVSHLLVTHSDHDHIAEADTYTSRFDLQVLAHPVEAERMDRVDGMLADGDEVTAGDLTITALLTPGHSPGHLSFLVNGTRLLHSATSSSTAPSEARCATATRASTTRSWMCS